MKMVEVLYHDQCKPPVVNHFIIPESHTLLSDVLLSKKTPSEVLTEDEVIKTMAPVLKLNHQNL